MAPSRRVLVLFVMLVLVVFAPSPLRGQATNSAAAALTNHDVSEMQKAGLAPEIIIAKIKNGPCNFDTSPAALKELKDAGVPDNVVLQMVESASPAKPAVTAEPESKPAMSSEPAHLRVYRAHRFGGSGLAPSIYVDDKQVVRIGSGRRCTIKLTPGSHTIRSDDKSSAISLDAKGGQEYYIRVDEEAGFWKGHGKLTLLAPEQGGPEYKLQKPVEDDRKFAKDMIEPDAGPDSKPDDTKKGPAQPDLSQIER